MIGFGFTLEMKKIEIDSFASIPLELKGKRKQYAIAKEVLSKIEKDCLLEIYDPPKEDLTR
jgi:pantoate kinase